MAMGDPTLPKAKWVCPNDRQLALRAKLKTGWSVKTGSLNSYAKPQPLSDEEQQRILQVIKKSEAMEQNEQVRVGRLVEKLEKMKCNALGNGMTACILCGEAFGLLGPTSYLCKDCGKHFCAQCGIETQNTFREQIYLCKLCSEAREIWKKSGAWFFKSMPKFVIPGDKPNDRPQRHLGSRNWDVPTTKKPMWARTRGLSTSEMETGESSEDDLLAAARIRAGPQRASSSTNIQVPNGSAKQSIASSDDFASDNRSIDSRRSSIKIDVSHANDDNEASFEADLMRSQSQLFHQLQQKASRPTTPQRTNKKLSVEDGPEGSSWQENTAKVNQKSGRPSMDSTVESAAVSPEKEITKDQHKRSTASTTSNISKTEEDHITTSEPTKPEKMTPASRKESSNYVVHRKVHSHRRYSTSTDDSANNSDVGESCYQQYRSRSSTMSAQTSDSASGRHQQLQSSPARMSVTGDRTSVEEQSNVRLYQQQGSLVYDVSPRFRRRVNTNDSGSSTYASHGNSPSSSATPRTSVTNANTMGVNYRQQHSNQSNTSPSGHSSRSQAATGAGAGAFAPNHRRRGSSSSVNSFADSEIAPVGSRHGSLSRRVSLDAVDESIASGPCGLTNDTTPASQYTSAQNQTHRSSVASGDNRLPVFSSSAGGEVEPQRRSGGGRSRPQAFTTGSLGSLEFSLQYDVQGHVIYVTVYRAKSLQPMDQSGCSDPYVSIQVLPAVSTKATEFRTKTAHRTVDPEFNETIACSGVMETDMAKKCVRLAVIDEGHYGYNCLGEIKVPLVRLKPNFRQMFNLFLEPPTQLTNDPRLPSSSSEISMQNMARRSSMPAADLSHMLSSRTTHHASSTGSHHHLHNNDYDQRNGAMSAMSHHQHYQQHHDLHHQHRFNGDRGRILLSLKYSTHRQGLLVGIVRCVGLMAKDLNGFSDPFVKVQLRPDSQHRKFKTSIKWKTLNPEFNEEFLFESKLKELPRKTLEISVWDKDMGRRDDYLGGLQIGINSKGEQLRHWFETIKNPDIRHDRWHFLLEEFIP